MWVAAVVTALILGPCVHGLVTMMSALAHPPLPVTFSYDQWDASSPARALDAVGRMYGTVVVLVLALWHTIATPGPGRPWALFGLAALIAFKAVQILS